MELHVLTLNVWTKQVAQRFPQQVAAIRALSPDVVCLQEVQSRRVADAFRREFSLEYECAYFRGRLTTGSLVVLSIVWALLDLPWVALSMIGFDCLRVGALLSMLVLIGLLWYNPGEATSFLIGNKTGLLLFVRRGRVTRTRTGATLFREWVFDYLNWLRPRGYLRVSGLLQGCGGEIPFQVITTHLDQPVTQLKGRGRVRQAAEILGHVGGFEGLSVLAGDFNSTQRGVPGGTLCGTYELFKESMNDASEGTSQPCVTWDQVNNPLAMSMLNDIAYGKDNLLQLDYIFWRHQGAGKVTRRVCKVVFKDPVVSDHYGLLASLAIEA